MTSAADIRGELERELRAPLADASWHYLVARRYIDEVEGGLETIQGLAKVVREIRDAFGGGRRAQGSTGEVRAGRGSVSPTVDKRQEALGRVYAVLATTDREVRTVRQQIALEKLEGEGFQPASDGVRGYLELRRVAAERVEAGDGLLPRRQVVGWIGAHHLESLSLAPGTSADEETSAIGIAINRGRKHKDLLYLDDRGRVCIVSVVSEVLVDLAKCASRLAEDWCVATEEATMLIVSGRLPRVWRWRALPKVRLGAYNATTRIVLEVDPDMDSVEVATAYRAVRRKVIGQRERVRPLGERALALAAWTACRSENETWEQRRRAWNSSHPQWQHDGPASNFARDATVAERRLLRPGWQLTGR